MVKYNKNYKPNNNYYYHQILHNDYNLDNLPPYFNDIFFNTKKINYIHGNICQF